MPDQQVLDQAQQMLMEYGRLQAENEALRNELHGTRNREEAEAERIRARNAEAVRPVCRLRWVNQPQNGAASVGDRIYRGRGPTKDRNTGRTLRHGSEFDAPAGDAVMLEESGYAEIIQGSEYVLEWNDPTLLGPMQARRTMPVVIPQDAAPAPAPGDHDAWNALVAHG